MTILRTLDPEIDREAVLRIWKEIGWLEKGKDEIFDIMLEAEGSNYVAEIGGEPECNVATCKGTFHYLEKELPFSVVASVLTSPVARRQGLAARLTAKAIAEDAAAGASLSGLGIFDQGFYNQLGYGTGSYENWVFFDPSSLMVDKLENIPKRITKGDWKKVHRSRLNRMKLHGSVDLNHETDTRLEMIWPTHSFGLGYYDDDGEITHHIYFRVESLHDGKYTVQWMTYRNREQFMELMSVLKSLSDQVHMISMREPPGIQFQDLLKRPFRHRRITNRSKFENKMLSHAYWQVRILDLESCINAFNHSDSGVKFNLSLNDPIVDLLERDIPWNGIGGNYTVKLGPEPEIESGKTPGLPTLKASVNAFTRLWIGVRSATSLAMTDDFYGPPALMKKLDKLLRLPRPHPDWDF
ncbi:MAG: GNAT family N-acetyltransferase [Thermoplasmata archaeon]